MPIPRVLSREQVFPVVQDGEASPRGIIHVERWHIDEGDGTTRDHYVWRRQDFVIVVPVTDDHQVVMLREWKYAQQDEFLTFPSGGIKPGETPFEAGARELREELGMEAGIMAALIVGPMANSPDKSTERHYFLLARHVRIIADAPGYPRLWFTPNRLLRQAHEITIGLQRLAAYEVLMALGRLVPQAPTGERE